MPRGGKDNQPRPNALLTADDADFPEWASSRPTRPWLTAPVSSYQFLQRFAFVNQKSNSAQTYVSCQSGSVVGFYSLAVGSVEPSNAAPRVTSGIPQHPAPVMILARLAVDLHATPRLAQNLRRHPV